jgi:hypothetical protein
MRLLKGLAITAVWTAPGWAQQPAGLREDVGQLREHVESREKSFSPAARAEALKRIAALQAALDTASAKYFEMEVARIIALADNGHSNAGPGARAARFNRVPLRLVPFGEDFFVLRATAEHADLLGARLVAIDGRQIDALRAAGRALSGGTNAWRDRWVPFFLESPEQMRTLGAISRRDSVEYRFELPDGRSVARHVVTAPPEAVRNAHSRWMYPDRLATEGPEWKALLSAEQTPWSLRDQPTPFRWRDAPEINAVVIEFRTNRDAPNHRIAAFQSEMETELRTRKPTNVVLDLRMNGGGDLNTTRNFMRLLPTLVPGRVFVLTSPWTFSAAISSVGYLKQAAPDRVTIVGEMVGDRLEFWAEGRPITLKNSGIMIGMATERHDYANGCAAYNDCHGNVVRNPIRVPTFAPAISAPWTIAAYRAGRDPGMEAIAAELRKQ